MRYFALFIWLVLCLLLGGLIHTILQTAFAFRVVRLLSMPGMLVRKVAMAVGALLTGATVVDANAYKLGSHEIGFRADGISSVSKVLVPLAPLFACALVLQAINALLGTPVDLGYNAPGVSALDASGARGFLLGMWQLMSHLVRQFVGADWGSLRLYVFLAFLFSLSLGACVSFEKFREAFLGVALVVVALAVSAALFGVRSGFWPVRTDSPASKLLGSFELAVMATGGMAVVMMLGGMLAAIVVSTVARICGLVGQATGRGSTKSDGPAEKTQKRMAA